MLKGTILIGCHNLFDRRIVRITPTPLEEKLDVFFKSCAYLFYKIEVMKIILTESQFKRVILKEESNDQDMMVRKMVNSQLIRGIVDITGRGRINSYDELFLNIKRMVMKLIDMIKKDFSKGKKLTFNKKGLINHIGRSMENNPQIIKSIGRNQVGRLIDMIKQELRGFDGIEDVVMRDMGSVDKDTKYYKLTESDLSIIVKKIINEQTDKKLTDKELIELMKSVYKKYVGGPSLSGKGEYKYDKDVEDIQKHFNSTGNLGDGKKYGKLKENGIYDSNTHWQVNNWLSNQIDNSFWKEHKHSFKR